MTYQIVVPIYKELPHIFANIQSIDDWDNLLIVDNSSNGWCRIFETMGAKVVYHPENIGVARSWNLGIKEYKDYTFFVSSSVKFNKGFSEVVQKLEALIAEKTPGVEHGLFTQLGWHCNGISLATAALCGVFDENFYPAYEEDVDYCRRLYLAGLHPNEKGITLGGVIPAVAIDAQPIEIAATIKRAGLHVNFNALRNYYIQKWGGDHGQETYDKPFGTGTLGYFPETPIKDLKEKYGL